MAAGVSVRLHVGLKWTGTKTSWSPGQLACSVWRVCAERAGGGREESHTRTVCDVCVQKEQGERSHILEQCVTCVCAERAGEGEESHTRTVCDVCVCRKSREGERSHILEALLASADRRPREHCERRRDMVDVTSEEYASCDTGESIPNREK